MNILNSNKPVSNSNYGTYDLGVAAALLASGFELLRLDRNNPKKSLFVFKQCGGVDDVADAYLADKLNVKARSYFDSIRALKNRLYANDI